MPLTCSNIVTFDRSYHYLASIKPHFAAQTNQLLPSTHRYQIASPNQHLLPCLRQSPLRRLRIGNQHLLPFEEEQSPEIVESRVLHLRWPQPIGKDTPRLISVNQFGAQQHFETHLKKNHHQKESNLHER